MISGHPISGAAVDGTQATTSTGTSVFVRRRRMRARSALGATNIIGAAPVRTDFHIYLWPYDGSSGIQLDAAGFAYYRGLGLNSSRDFYDTNGVIDQTALKTGAGNSVDYWAARSEALDIDLWWMDVEGSYYTGTSGDTNIVPDTQTAVAGGKSQWATHHGTTFYVGSYGVISGYQTDDTKSQQVSAALDFCAPEDYLADIYNFTVLAQGFASKKTALGITKPLIPTLLRSAGTLANDVYMRLVVLYNMPQVNGAIMWGTDAAAAGPVYYDNTPWMQGVKKFLAKYPITLGTPF